MDASITPVPSPNDSPFRGTGRLFTLGILSTIGYIVLALLSINGLEPGNATPHAITRFLQIYAFLFVCYWFAIAPLVKGRRMDPRHLWFAIAFALLFRAILLPSNLILENDIYRYMWDGHTSQQGINPFRHAPLHQETEPYRTEYWAKINYPNVPTIYPPTLQYVFFISESIYPGNIIGMKFILLVFDVATLFVLMALLEALKRPPEWCLIYAWSPLAVKEIANSGHADAVSAFFIAVAGLYLVKNRSLKSAIATAALTLTKFFGVLFLPLFHRVWRGRQYTLFFLAVFLLYLPFLSLDINPLEGFRAYSKEWRFNAGIFSIVEALFTRMGREAAAHSDFLARLSLFAVILTITFWQTIMLIRRKQPEDLLRAMFVVMGTLLLCSPVINTWYLIWLIPLICVFPNRAWVLLTGLIFLSYTYYYNHAFPFWVKWTEFGIFFYILFIDMLFPKKNWGTIGEWPPAQQREFTKSSENST